MGSEIDNINVVRESLLDELSTNNPTACAQVGLCDWWCLSVDKKSFQTDEPRPVDKDHASSKLLLVLQQFLSKLLLFTWKVTGTLILGYIACNNQ